MMSEKAKLRGALGAIERRAMATRMELNEFNESPPQASFEATKRILPNPSWDGVVRKILEIRVATSYANVKGDNDEAYRMSEDNAMRQLSSFLYEDVIHDLRMVMGELSAGKRHASMRLIADLMHRLTGGDSARTSKGVA